MKKLTIAAMATIVATVLAANTAEAQRQRSGRSGARGGQAQMMQRGGGMQTPFSPGVLLRQSEALELDESQIATLTELRDGLEAAGREVRAGNSDDGNNMRELMSADEPNLTAIREEFTRRHAAMSQFQWANIEAGINARNVLTDVQRGRVEGSVQRQRRGGQARGARGARRQQGGQRMRAPRTQRGTMNR